MNVKCPKSKCGSSLVVKDGSYYRTSDRKNVKRYKCRKCNTRFSSATHNKAYGQNKRQVNFTINSLLCSGVSMRRVAKIMHVHRITVSRKLLFLAQVAKEKQQKYLKAMPKVFHIQFDELITIEHTKCKPLSVAMAVGKDRRKILGFEVSVIPASGYLAERSRKKYGMRSNEKKEGIKKVFNTIKQYMDKTCTITTDDDTVYPGLIRKKFPQSSHKSFKGSKSCVSGQGELKKVKFDPLFSINHTFAMLRANINRLFRRTWSTTKKRQRLAAHLWLYMHFHNTVLTKS